MNTVIREIFELLLCTKQVVHECGLFFQIVSLEVFYSKKTNIAYHYNIDQINKYKYKYKQINSKQ